MAFASSVGSTAKKPTWRTGPAWFCKRPYVLEFLTNRATTWQRTSFVALKALAKEVILVEAKD
jgi:hypothetical protein